MKQTIDLNPCVTATWLGSSASWIFIGYGVRVRRLLAWVVGLFVFSTWVYISYGVGRETTLDSLSYNVRAFTVAPPQYDFNSVLPQAVMMIETFFGTLSIVFLGYVLGQPRAVLIK
jgi:hypothetical protein